MRCPVCGYESTGLQASCSQCGSFLGQPRPAGSSEPPHTFRYLLLGATVFMALLGFGVYKLTSHPEFREAFRNALAGMKSGGVRAVVHGDVIKPDELEARGKLYFVPMGHQAFTADSLAGYYRDKFRAEIIVLPEVAIGPNSYDTQRQQYIAEEMIVDMRHAYPKIARASDSIMIALTDEDIYPRSLGWKFTYSFHSAYRFAVVSSHRNDPAFWNANQTHDSAAQLTGMKQMLTKYVAMMYYHVPISFDPTSVMYQPLTPQNRPDDIFESDLHSEQSANGFRGSGWPCLIFSYSYETGTMQHLFPDVEECNHRPAPASVNEEIFFTQLSTGEFFSTAMDFQLDSAPPIEFRRSYRSQYHSRWALGIGTNDNYNTWLYSDGNTDYSFIDVIREDDNRDHFPRATPGKGFSPTAVFESREDSGDLYGARMVYEDGHYKLNYRDGSWSTFLNCTDGRCYWNGHQDAAGHLLRFDRDASLNLRSLDASDGQGVAFASDNQFRLIDAKDTRGNHVSYQYDVPGRLVYVQHADGQVTLYTYDSGHRVTRMSVIHKPGEDPAVVFTNEYDNRGRVVRQTLADGGVYQFEYTSGSDNQNKHIKVTEPSGRVLEVSRPSDYDYTVRATPVRFPTIAPNFNGMQ
jgi:YD repeat-containing protein